MKVPTNSIKPNPYNTREDLGDLTGLRASIRKTNGLLQPLIVRQMETGEGYELVFGGRRLQALRDEGYETLEAESREMSNEDMATLAICENVHRKDLNPVELARAYQKGLDATKLSVNAFSQVIGESDTKISSYLNILELPDRILKKQNQHTAIQLITLGRLNKLSSSVRTMLENSLSQRDLNSQFLRQIALACEGVFAASLPPKIKRDLCGEIVLQDYSHLQPENYQDIKVYANTLLQEEITKRNEALKKIPQVKNRKKRSIHRLPNPDRNLQKVTESLRQTQLHVQHAYKKGYYANASKKSQRKFRTAVNNLASRLEGILEDAPAT